MSISKDVVPSLDQNAVPKGAVRQRSIAKGRVFEDFQDEQRDTQNGLLPAEEKLLSRISTGDICEIGEARPDAPNPLIIVRATFLRFLALGGDETIAVHEKGVRLRGAFIEGKLDLECCSEVRPLVLLDCQFGDSIKLRDAVVRTLYLAGSCVPGIDAERIKIDGLVHLGDDFKSTDEVRFVDGQITGQFYCSGGHFNNDRGISLNCRSLTTSGDVFLGPGFAAKGKISFRTGHVGGDFNCAGAQISGVHGEALDCQGLTIGGSVWFVRGFKADGEVSFLGAEIGNMFCCSGGTFINKRPLDGRDTNASASRLCAPALILFSTIIKGTLYFGPIPCPDNKQVMIEGSLDLRNCFAKVLLDDINSWPIKAVESSGTETLSCYIRLDGFNYGRFADWSSLGVIDRKAWLMRQRYKDLNTSFRPQPFEHLIKVYREMGHEGDAREIAVFKERIRLRRPWTLQGKALPWHLNPINWLRFLFLEKAVGYGYRSHRIIIAALAVWFAAASFFDVAADNGAMAPTNPVVFLNPELQNCSGNWTTCEAVRMRYEHTSFQPVLYALDVLLPIVELGQEALWAPMVKPWKIQLPQVGGLDIPPEVAIGVMWFEIIFGWAVGLILIAVVGGAVRRD